MALRKGEDATGRTPKPWAYVLGYWVLVMERGTGSQRFRCAGQRARDRRCPRPTGIRSQASTISNPPAGSYPCMTALRGLMGVVRPGLRTHAPRPKVLASCEPIQVHSGAEGTAGTRDNADVELFAGVELVHRVALCSASASEMASGVSGRFSVSTRT